MKSPPSHDQIGEGENVEQNRTNPFPTPRNHQDSQDNPGGDQVNDQGQNRFPEAKMFVKNVQGKKTQEDGQQNA